MFEYLFEKKLVGAIGAKVVDDTKDFMIPVYVPPPPDEGKAVVTSVDPPSSFTPNISFNIVVNLRNDGGTDWIFARLINKDTGNLIKEDRRHLTGYGTGAWKFTISVTLPQETDFHGRIEAGHET